MAGPYLFIVNPRARGGLSVAALQRLLLRRPGVAAGAKVLSVDSVVELRQVLSDSGAGTVPVAVGGDGTANQLVRALFELGMGHRVFGTLPLGTGNAFAHSVGVGSVARALAALEQGQVRTFDVMCTSHAQAPVALVSISTGFESVFLAGYAALRGRARALGGVASLLRAAGRLHAGAALQVDGAPLLDRGCAFYNAGLYNQPCYAFGRRVFAHTDPRDGHGEAVVTFSAGCYWRLLCLGLGERPGSPKIVSRRWQRATLATDLPVQVDGDSVGPGTFAVHVERQALHVLTR